VDKFTKQPYEEFTVSSDFSRNFLAGETISNQAVVATDGAGTDVTATVTNQASVGNDGASKVSVLVKAGTESGSPYKLTFRCVTSLGHKWEHDVQMRVVEL
jgi:hypothetical protein